MGTELPGTPPSRLSGAQANLALRKAQSRKWRGRREHMEGSRQASGLWDGYGSEFKPEDEDKVEATDWTNLSVANMPRGLPLVRLCLRNVLEDLEIVVFQALSLSFMLVSLLAYILLVFPKEDWETISLILSNPFGILLLYPYFILVTCVGMYFQMATVGVATMRLQGKNPTIRDGLRIANSRLWRGIGFALINATAGMIFAMLRRSKKAGTRLSGSVAQLGWAVSVYFVIPVIVFENLDPFDAINRSARLVKQTWKDALIGNFGMGSVFLLLAFPSLIVLAVCNHFDALWIGIGFAIAYFLAIGVFSAAAHGVLLSALYVMATGGKAQDFAAYAGLKDAIAAVDASTCRELPPGIGERDISLLKYRRP